MKHIKLFENYFGNSLLKAISVFPENGSILYVGVFPPAEADGIYQALKQNPDYLVEIIDLPPGHDVVVSELGGQGLSSTSAEEFEGMTGEPLPPLVRAGENYDLRSLKDNSSAGIPFHVNRQDIGKFISLDGFGLVDLVSPKELV